MRLKENTLELNDVRAMNQEQMRDLALRLEENLHLEKDRNDNVVFGSKLDEVKLFRSNGEPFSVSIELKGTLLNFDTKGAFNEAEILVRPKNESVIIGKRKYMFRRKENEGSTLQFFSDMKVSDSVKKIGIGTSLFQNDESVRELLTGTIQQYTPETSLTKIEVIFRDATKGEEQGWTSRRLGLEKQTSEISRVFNIASKKTRSA